MMFNMPAMGNGLGRLSGCTYLYILYPYYGGMMRLFTKLCTNGVTMFFLAAHLPGFSLLAVLSE